MRCFVQTLLVFCFVSCYLIGKFNNLNIYIYRYKLERSTDIPYVHNLAYKSTKSGFFSLFVIIEVY